MKEQSGHSNCSELERIMKIMEPYIQSCPLYDIVRSDKFGYLLIAMSADDQIDDAEIIPLDSAETLLRELYTNLAYDFMQQEGHCIDYTKATALELRAMKEWMKPYTDQLPEYQYILEYLAGHERAKITLDIYAHLTYNRPEEIIEKINMAFAPQTAEY
ncbi:hypothetical protein [Intestinimonas butyriciproducens]|uniref:hypothetical protein n=1 Tax=Intestinimonas butyriciproducens TaxID=1297617 RepID=UPI000952CF6B|nr:hypothetical protein [Intestinimonas butyriciproducens]OLR68816.1 hypothetical protein BIV19_15180 [Intestinimonas butyriciproducens]